MKFLADENFPLASVRQLRTAGCEVLAVSEIAPGIKDAEVLQLAVKENAVILTFDRDYGELVYRQGMKTLGVVYFRFVPLTPEEPAECLVYILQAGERPLEGYFTVVERGQVRQRPLPP